MKLKQGKITFLFDHDGANIELRDDESGITFACVRLNREEVCQMLSRLGHTHCEIEVFSLDKVGKQLVHKPFEFEISCSAYDGKRKAIAIETVNNVCPKGWTPDTNFSSQESFFRKDNKEYARTIIRRWV